MKSTSWYTHKTQVIGTIDGSGRVRVVDRDAPPGTPVPEDLDLDKVLGKMPSKTYNFNRRVCWKRGVG